MTAPQYETYDDPDRLRELYWDAGMNQKQIANLYGVTSSAISRAMLRHGVKTRGKSNNRRDHCPYRTDENGYERWRCGSEDVYVHQLLAVASGSDPADVFGDDDTIVHHENGISWDNRPDNLKVMARGDHISLHWEQGDITPQSYDEDELLEWIDSFVEVLGVPPTISEMQDAPGPSPQTYMKYFGTWREAIREAGYVPRGLTE